MGFILFAVQNIYALERDQEETRQMRASRLLRTQFNQHVIPENLFIKTLSGGSIPHPREGMFLLERFEVDKTPLHRETLPESGQKWCGVVCGASWVFHLPQNFYEQDLRITGNKGEGNVEYLLENITVIFHAEISPKGARGGQLSDYMDGEKALKHVITGYIKTFTCMHEEIGALKFDFVNRNVSEIEPFVKEMIYTIDPIEKRLRIYLGLQAFEEVDHDVLFPIPEEKGIELVVHSESKQNCVDWIHFDGQKIYNQVENVTSTSSLTGSIKSDWMRTPERAVRASSPQSPSLASSWILSSLRRLFNGRESHVQAENILSPSEQAFVERIEALCPVSQKKADYGDPLRTVYVADESEGVKVSPGYYKKKGSVLYLRSQHLYSDGKGGKFKVYRYQQKLEKQNDPHVFTLDYFVESSHVPLSSEHTITIGAKDHVWPQGIYECELKENVQHWRRLGFKEEPIHYRVKALSGLEIALAGEEMILLKLGELPRFFLLKELTLSNISSFTELADCFRYLFGLEKLSLRRAGLEKTEANVLFDSTRGISQLHQLREIDISHNNMSINAIQSNFYQSIQALENLHTVTFSMPDMGNYVARGDFESSMKLGGGIGGGSILAIGALAASAPPVGAVALFVAGGGVVMAGLEVLKGAWKEVSTIGEPYPEAKNIVHAIGRLRPVKIINIYNLTGWCCTTESLLNVCPGVTIRKM